MEIKKIVKKKHLVILPKKRKSQYLLSVLEKWLMIKIISYRVPLNQQI